MLSVKGLHKSYGAQTVLKAIAMDVPEGCVTALIGPSGAGKTTLLRCLNFLERADEGTLSLGETDYDLKRATAKEIRAYRMRTAFVFQGFNLFLNKTALQNVTEGLATARGIAREHAEKTGKEMLERVGLSEVMTHYPHQLSGGQQQRVAIARALATNPEIIFMDEPTSALDPELTGEVLAVIKQLADDGMTMLVVTHEIAFAKTVAAKAVFMEHGEIVEAGDAGTIFTNPLHQRTRDFLKL